MEAVFWKLLWHLNSVKACFLLVTYYLFWLMMFCWYMWPMPFIQWPGSMPSEYITLMFIQWWCSLKCWWSFIHLMMQMSVDAFLLVFTGGILCLPLTCCCLAWTFGILVVTHCIHVSAFVIQPECTRPSDCTLLFFCSWWLFQLPGQWLCLAFEGNDSYIQLCCDILMLISIASLQPFCLILAVSPYILTDVTFWPQILPDDWFILPVTRGSDDDCSLMKAMKSNNINILIIIYHQWK